MGAALERLSQALGHGNILRHGDQLKARCPNPSHGDGDRPENWSMRIRDTETRVLLYCHGGCATEDILSHLNLEMTDLYNNPRGNDLAQYVYTNMFGSPRRIVHRGETKRFRQTFADSEAKDEPPPLYRLPKVVEAISRDQPIYLVEGEEDVHALESIGVVATTGPQGASNFHRVDVTPLRGAAVIAVMDDDKAGEKWRSLVKDRLAPIVASLWICKPAVGKDVSDHLAAGLGIDELIDVEIVEIVEEEQERDAREEYWAARTEPGGSFVLDAPSTPTAIWGDGMDLAWASGESLMLCGPPGVGKTTLAVQLVAGRLGLVIDELLGLPILPGAGRVLYLAMDRPTQIARAMRRLFTEEHRDPLNERLLVWKGPPPRDLAKYPQLLLELAERAGADTVVVDSLKDATVKLSDDETGAAYNRARQTALAGGVEVLELHHQRKAGGENRKPSKIDDVYGSTWLTAGAGSVIVVWGQPGDAAVELIHVKQPNEEIGPLPILHDHDAGRTYLDNELDVLRLVANQRQLGMTCQLLANLLFSTDKPDRAQIARARRKLQSYVTKGLLTVVAGTGIKDPDRYYLRAEEGE